MPDRSSRVVRAPTQIGNIWPPPPSTDETESEKARRLEKEIEALKVSNAIDQAIDSDRLEIRRRKASTKIVLLGVLFPPRKSQQIKLNFCPQVKRNPESPRS
jgi:hypothetical protein